MFVAEAQSGVSCLVIYDHVSEDTLAADNALVLLWQKLAHLVNYVAAARADLATIEGYVVNLYVVPVAFALFGGGPRTATSIEVATARS